MYKGNNRQNKEHGQDKGEDEVTALTGGEQDSTRGGEVKKSKAAFRKAFLRNSFLSLRERLR